MEIQMYQVLEFQGFYAGIKDQKLPLNLAYKLSKLAKVIDKEVSFYQEEFQKIVAEYAIKNDMGMPVTTEDGQGIKIQEGRQAEAEQRTNDLLKLEVKIEAIKFTIDELGSLNVSLSEMSALMPFIEE